MSNEKNTTSEKPSNSPVHKDNLIGIGIISWVIILGLGGVLLSISHYAAIFLILGMSPACIARIADKRIGNSASRTIGAFNFMGIVPFLFELFKSNEREAMAKHLATDPTTWFFVYAAAAMGWIAIWLIPQIISIIFSVRTEIRIAKLEKSQRNLIEEWGNEVTEGTGDYASPIIPISEELEQSS